MSPGAGATAGGANPVQRYQIQPYSYRSLGGFIFKIKAYYPVGAVCEARLGARGICFVLDESGGIAEAGGWGALLASKRLETAAPASGGDGAAHDGQETGMTELAYGEIRQVDTKRQGLTRLVRLECRIGEELAFLPRTTDQGGMTLGCADAFVAALNQRRANHRG